MGKKLNWVVGLWMGLVGAVALGQVPEGGATMGGGMMGAAAPAVEPTTRPAIEDAVMPEGPFNNVALGDLLSFLKDKVPGFNSVVIRSPGMPPDYPTFDNFSPKNITVGQFLDLVRTSYPGVDVQRIDGRMGPLYVFHIGGGSGMRVAEPAPGSGGDETTMLVRVYPLAAAVDATEVNGDSKKALDDVLSLLQTALDQQGGKSPAALKVHEATKMLVFKGTVSQMQVLEQALAALQPVVDTTSEMAKLKAQYETQLQRMQATRTSDQDTIDQLRQQLRNQVSEAGKLTLQEEELQMRLEQLKQSTATTKP